MEQHEHTIIKWAIGAIVSTYSLLFGWVFHRTNKANNVASEARIILAERHYTKLEVDRLVHDSIKPIHDKLDSIRDDVKYLVREKRGEG